MTLVRLNMLVIATAGLLGGLAIVSATPYQSANAQSGPALVLAEQACFDHGVVPHTASFESCVSRAADAFDRGQRLCRAGGAHDLNECSRHRGRVAQVEPHDFVSLIKQGLCRREHIGGIGAAFPAVQ